MQMIESSVNYVATIRRQKENRTRNFLSQSLRIFAVLGTVAVLALSAGLAFMLGVGHWLVKEDSLQKANAIAVLSGNFPARALEAASLYRAGYANEIWLTHPGLRSESLKQSSVRYPSEADLNYHVLRRQGVPAKSIHVLEMPIINTQDELEAIGSAVQQNNASSLIVVTNKAHTRRVHELWNRLNSSRGKIIVHALPNDAFQPSAWWTRTGDTQQVIHELLGMINVWAGLPMQPTLHSRIAVAQDKFEPTAVLIPATAQESSSDSDD